MVKLTELGGNTAVEGIVKEADEARAGCFGNFYCCFVA